MRCETCNLITRPDIAKAKGEERCTCDAEFEALYAAFQRMLGQNNQIIEKLADRFKGDT